MPHPLLEPGMILWKGKSPLSARYIVVRYKPEDSTSRALCAEDFEPTARLLQLKVGPHWNPKYEKSAKGVGPCEAIIFDSKEHLDRYPIDPLILNLMSGSIRNTHLTHVLKKGDTL